MVLDLFQNLLELMEHDIMKFSSADFLKLTVQDAVDFLIEEGHECAVCKGKVDGKVYNLILKLEVEE